MAKYNYVKDIPTIVCNSICKLTLHPFIKCAFFDLMFVLYQGNLILLGEIPYNSCQGPLICTSRAKRTLSKIGFSCTLSNQ